MWNGLFNAPKLLGSYFIENTHMWVFCAMPCGLFTFTAQLPEAKGLVEANAVPVATTHRVREDPRSGGGEAIFHSPCSRGSALSRIRSDLSLTVSPEPEANAVPAVTTHRIREAPLWVSLP